jgi:SPP1 gp7 family putative phage head morphogenesis protein
MSVAAQDIQFAIRLEPEAALAHLQAKGAQVSGAWREWLNGQHAQAFTVANVAKLDVVQDIQASLAKALKEGQSLQQWKDGLIPELQRKGWWQRDGSTAQLQAAGRVNEQGVIAKGLTPHRLKTIFQTNMQSAYMAGRYAEMMDQAQERPYWQYVAILDSKTRPAHRALNGKTFRYDDKAWGAFYPPNGFNCRCRVRNFSEREVSSRGIEVGSTEGKLRNVNVPLKGGGSAQVMRYTDAGLPGGKFQPDAGFSSNPGERAWQPKLESADVQLSRQYVEAAVAGPAFARFVEKAGAQQGAFPVAVLRTQDQQRLGTSARVAYLSDATLAKQAANHPEIALADYQRLPQIIDSGQVYADKPAANAWIFLQEDGFWYRAAVKATKREELLVLSLVRLSDARARALMLAKAKP